MKYAFAVLALLLVGCGGGGGSPATPSTPVPTPRPARSVLTLGASENTFTITSTQQVGRLTLKCGNTHVLWSVTESAGLQATVTKVDAYLLEADGDIDGRRVSDSPANSIVPASGVYRFTTDRLLCGYVDRDLPAIMRVLVDIRDDNGNVHSLSGEVGFTER